MTSDQYPLFTRLVPKTSFKGGRIADTDLLDLTEAAEFASVHAGKKITPKDFLRAAGRGEILLRARVHQTKRVQRVGGGDYFEGNQDTNGSIQNLPLSACKQLAAVGKAHWRGIDGFKTIGGILMRYTIAELLPDEPDFETVTADCMVTGDAVHALADAYIDEPAPEQNTAPPAPTEETKEPEYSGLTDSERKERARAINRATQAQWAGIKNGNERWERHEASKQAYWQENLAPAPPPRVESLTAPEQTAAPVVTASDGAAKRRRRTWRDVTEAYLECTFKELQCPTVKEFFAALTRKAGNGSPFDKGVGQNSGNLFARDVSVVVTFKMIEGFVTELRKKM